MNRLKVCFITPIYLPANLYGSDTYVRELAQGLAKKNFDISVITSNALTPKSWYSWFENKTLTPYEVISRVKVFRLKCNQLLFILNFVFSRLGFLLPKKIKEKLQIKSSGPTLIGLLEYLKKIEPDIIHCSPSPLNINFQLIRALKKLKKKSLFIFTPFFHSHVPFFKNYFMQEMFDAADIIHVISDAEKKDIMKMFRVNKEKFRIIPLFLNTENIELVNKKEILKFKKENNLLNKIIVLFAGIKGEMKGAINLLHAIDRLHKLDERFFLVTIGHNTSEWNKAKEKKHRDYLIDFGYKSEKEKGIVFASSDIFCLPSKSETFGLVYLEAWHKKKPVIAANIEATRELIGTSGLYVSFGNTTQLISAIKSLGTDEKLAKRIGRTGSDKLFQKYTSSKVFPKYINIFKNNKL